VVTRLWNSDFAGIAYRVLEEDTTPLESGERDGGARLSVSVLQADDHPSLDAPPERPPLARNDTTSSIAAYLLGVVTASRPETSEADKEVFVQDMLGTLFSASGDEKRRFLEEFNEDARSDKIAHLLEIALDFTLSDKSPVLENALGLAQRAVSYARAEADARTLAHVLTLLRERSAGHANANVRAALKDMERDIVDVEFLHSLGTGEGLPTEDVLGIIRYLRLVGPAAIPAIKAMLAVHSKQAVHRDACDALLEVAGKGIGALIASLDIDNVAVARDVVYLLRVTNPHGVTPVLKELIHYPDLSVREGALQLLTESKNPDAVALVCAALDDEDKTMRLRALVALEGSGGSEAADKVLAMCFEEDAPPRDMDERTRLFEAAGRVASAQVVERLERTVGKRNWLPFGASAAKDDKLLAVAALAVAGGQRARALLEKLAGDRDEDVKAAAKRGLSKPGAGGDGE
jgi:hypothetical protein